jgi:nucleoside-diphosphate-sugar epimerase
MKVLITGVLGYIGSVMIEEFKTLGNLEVTGLDTGYYARNCLYQPTPWSGTLIRKDVRDVSVEDLKGFDAIVHLGELSNDPLGELDPQVTYRINHEGSVHLAKTGKKAGVSRFVYSSSCSVYGAGTGDFKNEESDVNPQTTYAECKVLVERDVAAMADDRFSPTFLRNATAYGPSPHMRFDLVLNNLSGLAHTTREISMTSDGSPWRPLVHVVDISRAFACVLNAPRETVHNKVLNVGETGENFRVREIASFIGEAFPGCPITFGTTNHDTRSYRVNFDRIHELLPSFSCRHTARLGAVELHDLYARIRLTGETFNHRGFTRLKQLKHLIETGQLDGQLRWKSAAA